MAGTVLLSWEAAASATASLEVIALSQEDHLERARQLMCEFDIDAVPCCIDLATRQVLEAPEEAGTSASLDSPPFDAEAAFTQAVGLYNGGHMLLAMACFARLLKRAPEHKGALFNIASLCQMFDLPSLAVRFTARLLVLEPQDMTAHAFLWALAQAPTTRPSTLRAYTLLSYAGDVKATHKLAALTGRGGSCSRGDPAYARQIYDDMAEAFESKLVDRLGYRGPWQMHEILHQWLQVGGAGARGEAGAGCPKEGRWRVLDVGCGSGLCGKVFAALAAGSAAAYTSTAPAGYAQEEPESTAALQALRSGNSPSAFIAGIDISAKMVGITRRTGFYHALACCDLHDAMGVFARDGDAAGASRGDDQVAAGSLRASKAMPGVLSAAPPGSAAHVKYEGLDLIIAADTFIYVGALGAALAGARRALRPSSGLLLFSTEDLDVSPMRLDPNPSSDHPSLDLDPSPEGGGAASLLHDDDIPGAVPGWGAQLLSSARFAHSHAYVKRLAARHGYTLEASRQIVLRTEVTVPLGGRIYLLRAGP